MTGRFKPKPKSTRYPGGVRADTDADGNVTWYGNGRRYAPGTVGAHLSGRRH